jgi:hypothetical protein
MTHPTTHIAAVLDTLETAAAEDGHCCLQRADLVFALGDLGVTDGDGAITEAATGGHIVVRGDRVYLTHLDAAERDLAAAIQKFLSV